jgi:hypothetical protein
VGLIDEKVEGKKSQGTVPLRSRMILYHNNTRRAEGVNCASYKNSSVINSLKNITI